MKSPGNDKGKKDTSWGSVASWYQDHLSGGDTYHSKVIAPNIVRVAAVQKGENVLDLACGEGYFTRIFSDNGAQVVGADLGRELIAAAQKKSPQIAYHVASADALTFAQDHTFDVIVCVLALQNMERIEPVFKECARVLKSSGRFVFVLNHPAFRIPKRTAWGWDQEKKLQYRRVDGYLSARREKIDMAPGKKSGESTWSFHRSLQDYMKALATNGFVITRLEEWISHRTSEKGPRAEAEDIARKEFPLFLTVEVRKL
jgi:ubiquinone/menaquinone biosynthesis C-methylase UbiE